MAKKAAQTTEEAGADTQALATKTSNAMAVAGDVSQNIGKDNIGREDMTFPRLAFAQRSSPQVDPDSDEFIEGLELYQMYNSITREVYGDRIEFVIIRTTKTAMEFDAEGNLVDRDVALDDPRLEFTEVNGKRIKPKATLFYEYLIAVLRPDGPPDLAMLSLKTTQIKNAKALNSLIMARPGAIYAGKWVGSTRGRKAPLGSYTNFTALPAGRVSDDVLTYAAEVFQMTEGVKLDTNRDVSDDESDAVSDEVPF